MQGMIGMSKKDLIEFINGNFSEYHENDTIATFFYCSGVYDKPQQQCILFHYYESNENVVFQMPEA